MNAREAYENALWMNIPNEIRNSIIDSSFRGRFNTSYHILIGTSMWDNYKNIIDILTKLGYEITVNPQADEGKNTIIEYELKIYWHGPRKITY